MSQNSALTKCRIAGLAAEVERQRQPAGFVDFAREVRGRLWRLGAAEAIDRLLEVADEEQPAGVEAVAAEGFDEVDLQLVGVLKLVDEQQSQVVGEALAEVGVVGVGEQAVGVGEQVVEIELAWRDFAASYAAATSWASRSSDEAERGGFAGGVVVERRFEACLSIASRSSSQALL